MPDELVACPHNWCETYCPYCRVAALEKELARLRADLLEMSEKYARLSAAMTQAAERQARCTCPSYGCKVHTYQADPHAAGLEAEVARLRARVDELERAVVQEEMGGQD